jgi:hypothetical protein
VGLSLFSQAADAVLDEDAAEAVGRRVASLSARMIDPTEGLKLKDDLVEHLWSRHHVRQQGGDV